jgi:hypothetical protein
MSAEILLPDAEWERITAVCRNLPNDARPLISTFISVYRNLLEYKNWERRYDEAATLARKSAELLKRIEQYRNANVPESLLPAWHKNVEGLDELVDVLTHWTERFQETEKRGKVELKVSRDAVRTLIHYLGMIVGELDRSNEVEKLVATVLEIADPGMKKKDKKKNIRWQIRRAIEEWRQLQQEHGSDDEYFKNLERDPRFQESIKRLIPDLEVQKK